MDPAVSIITPTFNHERYIGACVESVLGQSRPDWEQIIIDDGSSDDTAGVVARLADPRIRYLRQPRAGLAGLPDTYNRALAMCRAPLVAILEGDDYWPADKLAALVPAFDDPSVVLAYGQTVVVGDPGPDVPPRIPSPELEALIGPAALRNDPVGAAAAAMLRYDVQTFTFACSVILRRSALERIGGFQKWPGSIVTDYPTFIRIALEGRFHYEPRTTGYWRVHDGGTTFRHLRTIQRGVMRSLPAFCVAHRDRLRLGSALEGQRLRGWGNEIGWAELREARRLLVERRWSEARPHLVEAARFGRWTTILTALAGLAGSGLGFDVEPVYRLRGRPWYRLDGAGGTRLVAGR